MADIVAFPQNVDPTSPQIVEKFHFFLFLGSFVRNTRLVEETETHILVGLLYFGKPVSTLFPEGRFW